ncbi:hypothetical protein F0919_16235 [Taibaiella lutea]|uniref:histidine kinase n=1 Tax=Taibaiella lutea TaxID=2608001 RepID=A0A5M6CBD4_9BACT|nr:sensor histidine kinase [Taibaiella lutea]KAA5532341.1 hypothetical protein F0919_16235 [Taibaiella lutea]
MIKSTFFIALFSFWNIHVALAQAEFKTEAEVNNAKRQVQLLPVSDMKVGLLLKLAGWYVLQDRNTAAVRESEQYVNQSLRISNKLKDKHAIAAGYLLLSRICQIRHNYNKGIAYATGAAALFESLGDKDQAGEAYVMSWSNNSLNGMPAKDRISILHKAAAAFHVANNKSREGDCLREAGDLYQVMTQYQLSLNDLRAALKLYQESGYKSLQGVYDLLGTVSAHIGNYNDGVKYGLMAIKSAEMLGDTSLSLCTYYNRLGLAYSALKDMPHAGKYFDKALVIANKYNDTGSIYTVSYNISLVLLWSKKPKESLDNINRLIKKYPGFEKEEQPAIASLMLPIYQDLKLYNKAAVYCTILENSINKDSGNMTFYSRAIAKIISFYIETGNLQKASFYVKAYAAYTGKESMGGSRMNYNMLQFRVDSAMGNYLSAIRHYQIYAGIKDSLLGETKSLQINQLNIEYETDRKDKDILLLRQGAALQKNNLRHVTLIRNITFAGVFLLIIILFLLFNGFRRKQKTNNLLQRQQKEIHDKNNDLQKLVTEKEWLIKEIHHRVKNNLHMVVGLLASQTEFLKGREALSAITDSQNRVYAMSLIHQKLYQTEELSSTDMPSYIFDLTEYLKGCFDQASEIAFRLNIAPVEFSLAYSVPIGLIINEAVTNAIKYAFPTGKGIIEIGLQPVNDSRFMLYIQDNGKGLPDDFDFRKCSSLGLTLIEGLSTDIEGSFNLSSRNGTRVEIEFMDEVSRNEMH